MCTSTLKGYRSRNRTEKGKQPIVFSKAEGFTDQKVNLGCGQCLECRMEYARNIAIRCCHEAQIMTEKGRKNCFVTFTYNDDNLPFVKSLADEEIYIPTLYKPDLRNFWKRLRKDGNSFRYFASGEYGGNFGRPHYHALLFGYAPSDCYFSDVSESGYYIYDSEYLEYKWSHGNVYVQDMSFETAFYCAGYALKKLSGEGEYFEKKFNVNSAEQYYNGVQPEFSVSSRRPGLGYEWLEKYRSDVYPLDRMNINGLTLLPPRYYYNKQIEYEESNGIGRRHIVHQRMSETEIQQIKKRKARKMDQLKDEIKYQRETQNRTRGNSQSYKRRKYEQRKAFTAESNNGKDILHIRQKKRRVPCIADQSERSSRAKRVRESRIKSAK